MSEQTPEPTALETVARLAAEAAVRACPDLGPRLAEAEEQIGTILQTLQAAASPEGSGARLAARIAEIEQILAAPAPAPAAAPAPAPVPDDGQLAELMNTLAHLGQRLDILERNRP